MRGIIIAAGRGIRMRPLTEAQPKCLLPIAGRTLLDWTIDGLRGAGCDEIVLITGHAADAIHRKDVTRVQNTDFENNNILHSLMYAREFLNDDCLISYSDIWVEPFIFKKLVDGVGDIRLAADQDWTPYYLNRSEHPIEEAENIFVDPESGLVRMIGKHLAPEKAGHDLCCEFLGLWYMNAVGAKAFKVMFETVEAALSPNTPFQKALEWRKAYITDLVQELVNAAWPVGTTRIERGWAELDTQQDYDRLMSIADRQRLDTLSNWQRQKEEARHEHQS